MNNSIETAAKATGSVTAKELLAVIKKGNRHYLHAAATTDRPSWSDAWSFTLTSTKESKKAETTTTVNVPGYVSGGETSHRKEHTHEGRTWSTYDEAYKPTEGFWSLWGIERVRDVLELLPKDATVAFHVSLDAGTNELCVKASAHSGYTQFEGLHSDHLYLVAETKRGEKRFLIDTHVGAHNTARFGGPKG